jgi:3-phenylpropionate/trans-cinnamate dioxygenase ferredoxin reductase component
MTISSKYLIVGGGMTADAAARGIRELDATGKIIMLSDEHYPPYDRPPLSKKMWAGKPLDSIFRGTEENDVELRLETRATSGDPVDQTITDHFGNQYVYEKLLLATGGYPRRLPFGDDGVIYFRTLDDYQQVRALAGRDARVVVIGAGFIGSEIAAALAMNGCAVSMVFPGSGIGSHIYPPALSGFLDTYFQEKGVTLLPREAAAAIERTGQELAVRTRSGKELLCDCTIAGIGIEPDVALAKSLGLDVDNGIVVDEYLRTTHPNIYAAGDVANFYSPALGVRRRVEHEDNANIMGAAAGRNMAGADEKYRHLPYFYTDLFDLGYEAVGELASDMEIVEDWAEPYRKGVLYYLRDSKVRGVLLWDTWGQVDVARQLICTGELQAEQSLKGRIAA